MFTIMRLSESSDFYRNSAYLSLLVGIILIIRALLSFEFSILTLLKSFLLPLICFYITVKFYNRDGYRYSLSEALFSLLSLLIPVLYFINLIQVLMVLDVLKIILDLALVVLGIAELVYYVYY